MWYANESYGDIARRLGRHRSTIGREIRRNWSEGEYSAVMAQSKAEARRRHRPLKRKMEDPETGEYVGCGLARYWSPDQIAGRSRRDFSRHRRRQISHQTIYAWIDQQGEERAYWEQFLRLRSRRRRKYQQQKGPGAASIVQRPAVVDRRSRYGDWEGDTVMGVQPGEVLVTLVERKSRYLLTDKAKYCRAKLVCRKTRRLLVGLPEALRRTLTLDNGKEFRSHQQIADCLRQGVYFAQPYCSWQRGTNENINGLLRQFFPKGSDFRDVSRYKLKQVQQLLNDRPRKTLQYRTPSEVFAIRRKLARCN
jgi:IS30 family transposase